MEGIELRFHHLGVACRDLDQEERGWLSLGYKRESDDFVDPIQQVRGRFLVGNGPRLELLAEYGPTSPIPKFLSKGIKIYHTAYEVEHFDRAIETMRSKRFKLMSDPARSVAFGGRRIAFLMQSTLNLVEIIEGA